MNKLLYIIAILIFGLSYGQEKKELNLVSTHWITKKCSDLKNKYENDLCVRQELNQYLNKNINWSLTDNLKKGSYKIRASLMVEKNGKISKVKAKSQYKELNNEIEKILINFQDKINLVDQNGKSYKNNLILPITFILE